MDADPQETYPRIDPAIIVAVRNKDTLLMARNAQRPGFFSLIAGYVSVEETIEDTVARELMEETGLRCHNVQYWGSQPWRNNTLMLGFFADSDGGVVGEPDGELEEIRWMTRHDIEALGKEQLPNPASIARRMINEWIHDQPRRP